MIRIGLVADDLTGACDSAAPFLAGGRAVVGLWPLVPAGGLACAAVSTESRGEAAPVARSRSREAASRLECDLLFRKLDSLLRGHPAADVAGVIDALGGRCLVAPALPAEGRTTAGGIQRWPGGDADLRLVLAPLADRVDLRDAATDADLDDVAREALGRGDRVLAGTAGLASALARALGLGPP
ncbi:MAG TPA: four-carbon acid sugar kinase family protein, partial [Candidatus Eisenbacteria bacterium]|nr:four-carbon acid sugar kinase family protein [Candidatus Eisenbacteria bacterium]